MTLRVISTSQVNTSVGGEIVNNLGSPNLTVVTGDEVVVFENVTLAADGSLVDVSNLDNFDFVMHGNGFAGSNAFRMDYQSNLGTFDFEISLIIGNDATITSNVNLGFFGVLSSGISLLQDGSELRFDNAGTASAVQGRGFEIQSIAEVQAANSGTVTAGQGPAFLFENVMDADFINSGTAVSTLSSPSSTGSHLGAAVAFNSQVINVQFTNTGTVIGNVQSLVSEATTSENITNTGILAGDVFTSFFTGATSTFNNSGEIQGTLDTRNGDDVVKNSGLITGDVELGENNDFFTNAGGGIVAGAIRGDSGDDTIVGAVNAEEIDGGIDNDRLVGNAGDDTLVGGDGQDTLFGGSGDDDLNGDALEDTLFGGAGDDTMVGGSQDDVLIGGSGTDEMRGGTQDDTLRAGDDNDDLDGQDGIDFLFGDNGNDTLAGGADNDFLRGGAGDDSLEGGAGVDDLRGGLGDDQLFGGAGGDRMYGGLGADAFVFEDATDSQLGSLDTIFDFKQGEDVLDFDSFVGEFDYVGTGAHSGGGDASIRYLVTALGTSVRADVDGDGSSDLIVTVRNLTTMTEDDFIL